MERPRPPSRETQRSHAGVAVTQGATDETARAVAGSAARVSEARSTKAMTRRIGVDSSWGEPQSELERGNDSGRCGRDEGSGCEKTRFARARGARVLPPPPVPRTTGNYSFGR